jgi:hypothetical protein
MSDITAPPPPPFTDSTLDATTPQPPTNNDNRLLANRANALLSTGPRTTDGKARSAQNAFRHGLRARLDPAALVPATEQSDYADFLADIRDHLDPQSSLDDLLVERIALLGWKLRRHAQAEAHLLDLANQRELDRVQALNRAAQEQHDQQLAHNQRYRIKTPLPPPSLQPLPSPEPAARLLARFSHSEPSANPLATLQRYESATERAFYKALIQYRILRTASSTTSTSVADLHHHFHYHRHNDPTADQPPSPPPECAKFPNEPNPGVPNPPSLPEPIHT